MGNELKESVNINFTTSTDSNVTLYQYSSKTDVMYQPEIIECSGYPIFVDFAMDGSSIGYNSVFESDQSLSSNSLGKIFMPAGSIWNFWIQPTSNIVTGNISLAFTPADVDEIAYTLPANMDSQSRILLASFIPQTYASLELTLLSANELPLKVEVFDNKGNIIGSNDYFSVSEGTGTSWSFDDVTLQPNESYDIYITNISISGDDVTGYFDLKLFLTESDSVKFNLQADTTSTNIYTRISPSDEYISSIALASASEVPVQFKVNNGTTTINHVFTAVGEQWVPEPDFYLPFGCSYPFELVNETSPLTTVDGQLDLAFTPRNNME